jgi:diguanylate cyclase (GGDEF)-like protein
VAEVVAVKWLVARAVIDGVGSPAGAAFGFGLPPPFHQVGWFTALTVLLLSIIGVGVLRLRARHARARERELVRLVEERTHQLREANARLDRLSRRDALTGVANRRHFEQVFEAEWRRALRAHAPLALLMIDIDEFKRYNDVYGHQAGDGCLMRIAAVFDAEVQRAADLVARYGGEEFAVILPGTAARGAVELAERLRAEVEALCIPRHEAAPIAVVTISIGVACGVAGLDLSSPELLLSAADHALYGAKNSGRNRVVIAQSLT